MSGYIYVLSDPRTGEPRYVGKTMKSVKDRMAVHMAPSHLKQRSHRASWLRHLREHGYLPEVEVLEQVEGASQLAEAECFWIEQLRALGFRLTNLTVGGEGTPGFHHTAETKLKLAAATGRQVWDEERRRKHALALQGRKMPPRTAEHRAKIAANTRRMWVEGRF